MRALVISDTHFGAWTGRDLLREEFFLERLAPHLEEVDELIFLGDLFDFLFGSLADALDSADGLLRLLGEKLVGRRLVFIAGNHDHHLIHRGVEERREIEIATGTASSDPDEFRPGPSYFQAFLKRRLPAVEIEIAYPTYAFANVLCTHGHYLDPHARLSGSRGARLLTRTLWAIAAGGPEEPRAIGDYESVITLLTEWLYIAAQMPQGTHAQQSVFRSVQRLGRRVSALSGPLRGVRRLAAERVDRDQSELLPSEEHFQSVLRGEIERQHREEPVSGAAGVHPIYPEASVVSPSDPSEHALEAFAQVVENLGWNRETERIVFAHTHQPLADVRSNRESSTRYWNTGSWIFEPDLSSRRAYARYLRYAWPGTAVLIDDQKSEPTLIEMLADLNPLVGGSGMPV